MLDVFEHQVERKCFAQLQRIEIEYQKNNELNKKKYKAKSIVG